MAHIAWAQPLLVQQAGTTWCASTTCTQTAVWHVRPLSMQSSKRPRCRQPCIVLCWCNRQGQSRCTCVLEDRQSVHWCDSLSSVLRHCCI